MNLFATILTYSAPSANYRGESELNRSVIQNWPFGLARRGYTEMKSEAEIQIGR